MGIGPIMGPTAEDCIFAMFSYLYKTRAISSLVLFVLGRVRPLLRFMDMLGVRSTSYSKSPYPLNIMYMAF